MHLYAYRANPNIGAIVHTHPPYCIAFTLVEQELPIMFPDQAALVGKTVYVPYVLPTTDKLADAYVEKVNEASSILLGNHGLVTTGRNLARSLLPHGGRRGERENFLIAKAIKEPKVLTEEEYRGDRFAGERSVPYSNCCKK